MAEQIKINGWEILSDSWTGGPIARNGKSSFTDKNIFKVIEFALENPIEGNSDYEKGYYFLDRLFEMFPLHSADPYNIQNALVRQVNFPIFYYNGDIVNDWYSDYATGEGYWQKALQKYGIKRLEVDVNFLTPRRFINFVAMSLGTPKENIKGLTGAVLTRNTNVSSGYPVYYAAVFKNNKNVPVFSSKIREPALNVSFNL